MLTWFAEVKSVDGAKYKTPCQTRGRAGRSREPLNKYTMSLV